MTKAWVKIAFLQILADFGGLLHKISQTLPIAFFILHFSMMNK